MTQRPITGTSQVYATFGKPNKGSPSPVAYNAAFGEMDVDAVYIALEPLSAKALTDAIRSLQLGGGTVTKPFKQEIIALLDEVDTDAQTIGAVNVVVNKSGHLIGFNSDWLGALNALKSVIDPAEKKIALLGAGGAARAVAFGLSKGNADVTVFNRTESTARDICESLSQNYGGSLEDVKPEFDVIVNATSVGFGDDLDSSPISSEAIREGSVVFDIIARPKETKLLKLAKEKNCTTIFGGVMGAHQAVYALEWLTGVKPPLHTLLEYFTK